MSPVLSLGLRPVPMTGPPNPDPALRRAPGWVAFAGLLLVTLCAALHNRGLAPGGVLAWLACFLLPGAAGARPERWLARPRHGWRFHAPAALAVWLLPTVALAVLVEFGLGALFHRPASWEALAWLLSQAATFATLAAAEEFFFRGWLQQTAWAATRHPVLWSALACAAAHVAATGRPWFAPAWFGSSLVLGWVVRRAEGSLWPALLLHATGNLAVAWTHLLVAMNLHYLAP